MEALRVSRREAQRPLWDLMLQLQSRISYTNGGTANSIHHVQTIESRRRKALFGPQMEDIVGILHDDTDKSITDSKNNNNNNTVTTSKLMALSESLMRNDGYDVSSRIANGLDRMVDSLEITGLLRGTSSHAWSFASVTAMSAGLWNNDGQDDEATGPTDASLIRRMRFQRATQALNLALAATGKTTTSATTNIHASSTTTTSSYINKDNFAVCRSGPFVDEGSRYCGR